MANAYSFAKKDETDEIHIFQGEKHLPPKKGCSAAQNAVCKKAKQADSTWITAHTCLTEQDARLKAAQLGRKVCGTCVSHLYTTY